MTLKLFNTLGRKVMEFKPLHDNEVRMYSCGPTVYNYVHIGNLRAFVFTDLLRRYLKYKGYKLKHVMNLTDVDDKTIKNSQKDGKSLKEFTEFYSKAFLEDIKALNIEIPEIMPKATEHVKEMVDIILKLKEKGLTYESNGTIYYKISKFNDYGKLALIDVENLKNNADGRLNNADEYEKDDARDFALWKSYDPEDGDVSWDTDIGKGRPGWHIECSAMSMKYLGDTLDIHTGGKDLVFPHHTNEIAQSEGSTGKQFTRFWLHNNHLVVNGEKMSKSQGNFYTLRDLTEKGYSPKAIRYELIATHYRQKLDFREENLKKIPETLNKFYDFLDKLDEISGDKDNNEVDKLIKDAKTEFEKEMDNDLNISGGLAAIFKFMTEINKIMDKMSKNESDKVKELMMKFDSVIGVMEHEKGTIDSEIDSLIQKREDARKAKDFATADKIRDSLKSKGIELEDTSSGVRWKKR